MISGNPSAINFNIGLSLHLIKYCRFICALRQPVRNCGWRPCVNHSEQQIRDIYGRDGCFFVSLHTCKTYKTLVVFVNCISYSNATCALQFLAFGQFPCAHLTFYYTATIKNHHFVRTMRQEEARE